MQTNIGGRPTINHSVFYRWTPRHHSTHVYKESKMASWLSSPCLAAQQMYNLFQQITKECITGSQLLKAAIPLFC